MKIILVLVVGLISLFILQNSEESTVRFLIWSLVLPKSITLLGVFLSGLITGLISFWLLRKKNRPNAIPKVNPSVPSKDT